MFWTFPFIEQAIALKFRLLSIHFTSEAFASGRKLTTDTPKNKDCFDSGQSRPSIISKQRA